MKIRKDVRFSTIPEWILFAPSISANAVRAYGILDRFADQYTGQGRRRRKEVAEKMNVSVKTLDRALDELKAIGAITVTEDSRAHQGQVANVYTLHVVPFGATQGAFGADPPSSPVTRGLDTDDQGPSSRVTSHRTKASNRKPRTKEEPTSPAPQDDARFADFWETYPRRHGKKLAKGKAAEAWMRLKNAERDQALAAVAHYRQACDSGMTLAKDAFRWLRDRAFEDWLTPASPEAETNGHGPYRNPPKEAYLDTRL